MIRLNALRRISLLFICSAFFYACNSNTQVVEPTVPQPEKLSMRNPVIKKEPKIYRKEISYTIDSLKTRKQIDSLFNAYSEEQLQTILALNRIEKNRLRPERPIVIPDCASEDFKAYSPFPETINSLQCIPKTVLISQRVQAFGLYENGELVKWGPVSTGKNSTRTPNGLNYGNYKAKRKVSTVDDSWILPYYFNFMNFEGVGVHQYALPGYPASHGCVRLYMDDAKYIFEWADMWNVEGSKIARNGTPFMVFGEYDYSSDKPWINLSQNMKANDLTQDEINTLENYIQEYHEDPKNFHNIASKNKEGELAKA
ncbi:L,D-transpeptidase-like protein [Christiangramia gaetbulicola]|uniref:L,D-transpeptidase-like protein n=1 Tax=Christiangramia gaetbulicola TaxID=703340 RepID=A0A2T6AF59_9FLAO|nr:L,D-transpeptidase [Christiangramia gaetbulicola]PTX42454.1 L,D-transpeptidase-like protein [Christiangramia gaetbulicola]